MPKWGIRKSTEQWKEYLILFYLMVFLKGSKGKCYLTSFNVTHWLVLLFYNGLLIKNREHYIRSREVPSDSRPSHEFDVGYLGLFCTIR